MCFGLRLGSCKANTWFISTTISLYLLSAPDEQQKQSKKEGERIDRSHDILQIQRFYEDYRSRNMIDELEKLQQQRGRRLSEDPNEYVTYLCPGYNCIFFIVLYENKGHMSVVWTTSAYWHLPRDMVYGLFQFRSCFNEMNEGILFWWCFWSAYCHLQECLCSCIVFKLYRERTTLCELLLIIFRISPKQ